MTGSEQTLQSDYLELCFWITFKTISTRNITKIPVASEPEL